MLLTRQAPLGGYGRLRPRGVVVVSSHNATDGLTRGVHACRSCPHSMTAWRRQLARPAQRGNWGPAQRWDRMKTRTLSAVAKQPRWLSSTSVSEIGMARAHARAVNVRRRFRSNLWSLTVSSPACACRDSLPVKTFGGARPNSLEFLSGAA
jgi:hypothetical protein